MNMNYLDHARNAAVLNFMADHDFGDNFVRDLELAFDQAREIYHHETTDDVWAAFTVDDQGPIVVHLTIVEGAIAHTVVEANWMN